MSSTVRFARLTVLTTVLFAGAAWGDVFSPGPLARAHAELEGLENCTECHLSGEKLSERKCLDCHTELSTRVREHRGFHGRMRDDQRTCQNCHHDHQGRDFAMVEWLPSKKLFPHADTGYALKGKHAKVSCEGCHNSNFFEDTDIKGWLTAHPLQKETYLGLSTECESCHFDEHRGQLKSSCQSCHDEKGFKPAPGFKHSKTHYPLTGKHQKVACKACHALTDDTETSPKTFPKPVSMKYAVYSDIPHASCLDCHKDPHQSKFGDRCESCHTTQDWKTVHNAKITTAGFHDNTRYPLRGLHAAVPCQSCHGPFPGVPAKFKNMAFGQCSDCHVDAHEGQLTKAPARKSRCEDCHAVEGFVPARYGIAEHQKTSYPLEGAHAAVPCSQCHIYDADLLSRIPELLRKRLKRDKRESLFSLALFTIPGNLKRCETCHADAHAGQFKRRAAASSQGCLECHQVSSFHDVTFNHDRDSRFALTGKHIQAPCAGCHATTTVKGQPVVHYRPLEMGCQACHADIHAGQFKDAAGRPQDCATCHSTTAFKPATFVHAPPFTDYLLQGKHPSVPCAQCHPTVKVDARHTVQQYLGVPRTCAGCHKDFHDGQFKGFIP